MPVSAAIHLDSGRNNTVGIKTPFISPSILKCYHDTRAPTTKASMAACGRTLTPSPTTAQYEYAPRARLRKRCQQRANKRSLVPDTSKCQLLLNFICIYKIWPKPYETKKLAFCFWGRYTVIPRHPNTCGIRAYAPLPSPTTTRSEKRAACTTTARIQWIELP